MTSTSGAKSRSKRRSLLSQADRGLQHVASKAFRRSWGVHVNEYRARFAQSSSTQQDRSRQDLASMLQYAYRNVPLHARRMNARNMNPWRDAPEVVLASLPTMSRHDVREHADDLRSLAFPQHQVRQFRTGGTTTVPLPYFQDESAIRHKNAMADALRELVGWRSHDRIAFLWGAEQDLMPGAIGVLRRAKRALRHHVVERALYLSSTRLDDAMLSDYVTRLKRFEPHVLQAYGSAADLLASYLKANHDSLNVPVVILTAEQIFQPQRDRVASALHANVLTFYGSRELGWIASECPSHHQLHINTAGVWLETSNKGELIATDLRNRAMPFLRYETGDRAIVGDADCPCGDPRPVLRSLEGRTTDVFIMPSGKRVLGSAIDLRGIAHMGQGILSAQIVQDELSALDIYYVPAPDFIEAHELQLQQVVATACHREVDVRMHRVARLKREHNGKVRYSICRLSADSIPTQA